MKKLISLLALLTFFTNDYAQVKYSISGGINISDLKNDWELFDNPDIIPRFGYSIGSAVEIPVRNSFFFTGQLAIVSKNYALDVEDFYGAGTVGYDRYSVLYLDLPVLAGYCYREFRLFAGPFFDICLGGTNNHKLEYFNGYTDQGTHDIASARELKSSEESNNVFPLQNHNCFDAGIVFGIGHCSENFSIDLSHSYGLVNIFPKVDGNDIDRDKYFLFTRVFTLRLNIYLF